MPLHCNLPPPVSAPRTSKLSPIYAVLFRMFIVPSFEMVKVRGGGKRLGFCKDRAIQPSSNSRIVWHFIIAFQIIALNTDSILLH